MLDTTLAASNAIINAVFIALPMLGSLLLAFGIYQVVMDLRSSSKQKVLDRLRDRGRKGGGKERAVQESILRKRAQELTAGSLDTWVSKLSVVPKLQTVLDQANLPWSATKTLVNLFALSLFTIAGGLVAQYSILTALAAGGSVFALPLFYFSHRRKKRLKRLVTQLPDSFELISQALRAGHSLASGIQLASEQLPEPIAMEFGRVFHEQNLGIKIEDAMKGMAERCGQMDVKFFVTAVLIQRQTGGDLAEVLDKMGAVIRDRIQLMGTVQALTAEGRLSGWVLLALPVVVFIVLLQMNYEYASTLLHDPSGRMLLFAAGGMQLMGLAMIKKIVNIKV